jgi:hypothetical protein
MDRNMPDNVSVMRHKTRIKVNKTVDLPNQAQQWYEDGALVPSLPPLAPSNFGHNKIVR